MKDQVVTNQAEAIEVLANLLHVKRVKIAALVTRKRHPLPLPPTEPDPDHYKIDDRYLRRLRQWVVEEKSLPESSRTRIDLVRIEKELTLASCPEHRQRKWSVEDAIEHCPPGDFLG